MYKKILLISSLCLGNHLSLAAEWSGNIATEARYFLQDSQSRDPYSNNLSVSAQAEFYHSFKGSRHSFTFEPFIRADANDEERSHADIRELNVHIVKRDWELKAGISKVFWGKTETAHLVDIINQTDALENVDGEDKLGQAMLNLSVIKNWGVIDFFVLPGFRTRAFADDNGRPQLSPLPVSNDFEIYESSKKNRHIDYAARWSHSVGIWDIGLSQFRGTSRDPSFDPTLVTLNEFAEPELIPIYNLISQTGIDLQATSESWLWKLEMISRSELSERYNAVAAGLEYTFVGIMGSNADAGIVVEYLYDDRGDEATTPFDDDLAIGTRFTLNDAQSTSALIAIITDLQTQEKSYFIEASRRLGNRFRLDFELRGATDLKNTSALTQLRRDRFAQIELAIFF